MMRTPILMLRNKRSEQGQHPGLLLQRYLCENATGEGGNPEEKRALLQAAINAAASPEVREIYKLAFDRWQTSLPESTAACELQTPEKSRLIIGLGSESVLETGISLHHTYGMPVLPGSALKGLAAHYCDQVWGERSSSNPSDESVKFRGERKDDRINNRPAEPQGVYHSLIFGSTDDGGCITFHDAWFVPDSEKEPLKLDVMTPHHPKWIAGSAPPTDFDSPNPVPFLSVAGTFFVAVSWCGPDSDHAVSWRDMAMTCLRDALFHWGIGGKTSSGYGRLDLPPPPPPPEPYKGTSNEVVDAVLLEQRTKKGGWRAQIKGHSQVGPILNNDRVPTDANPGDVVKLVIASINDREVQFKWPQPAGK